MVSTNYKEAARQLKRKVDFELRGLAYFDSFDELERWTEVDVDPLQKSNTPLLRRPEIPALLRMRESSNVMLMHNYRGNYVENGYEACQGAIVNDEDYVLEQWQRVEAFNYFTHYQINIPPPTWVNAGHRNGALVLGTFCIDGEKGHPELIFRKKSDGKYQLADILARMAICYGFDRWLINIEVSVGVSTSRWNRGEALKAFLNQLREGLKILPSGGKVIWFDTLAKDDRKARQNTPNADNVAFVKAAGSVSTNYCLTPKDYISLALDFTKNRLRLDTVYIGINCWGQTNDGGKRQSIFGFDIEGGEGSFGVGVGHGRTATGLAVKQLAPHGLGFAVFALGWAYEHFARGRVVDRFMWEGKPDLNSLIGVSCRCKISLQQYIRADFKDNSFAKFAKQYPAGSEGFFYTDYKEAMYTLYSRKFRVHLGQQSILPAPGERSAILKTMLHGNASGLIVGQLKDVPSRYSIDIAITAISSIGEESQLKEKLLLHRLNARGDLNLDLIVTYRRLAEFSGVKLRLFALIGDKIAEKDLAGDFMKQYSLVLPIRNTQDRITAIGIAVQGSAQSFAKIASKGILGLLNVSEKMPN